MAVGHLDGHPTDPKEDSHEKIEFMMSLEHLSRSDRTAKPNVLSNNDADFLNEYSEIAALLFQDVTFRKAAKTQHHKDNFSDNPTRVNTMQTLSRTME